MAGRRSGDVLDKWREYFSRCDSDIFDVIERGIMVAACDYPQEFRLRRDRIAQILFSSKLSKCVGCDHVELLIGAGEEDEGDCEKREVDRDDEGEEEEEEGMYVNKMMISNYSYGEAEALTDEIEKESQMVGEVLRIKRILENSQDEPDLSLVDSLRRLELMSLSVEILKATEIGKAVNALRKHASKDIKQLARKLIDGWKVMVDEWVNATTTITGELEGGTPESMNPSTLDEEEGLPSPPLDDLAFFATQPTSMELSQFFDGMDDDENVGNIMELNRNSEKCRKPRVQGPNIVKQRQRHPFESNAPPMTKKDEQIRKEEASVNKQGTHLKPNKPSIVESGPGRPTKPSSEHRVHHDTKLQRKPETVNSQRPPVSQQNKSRCSDEASVQVKLEATKRKLQERYQQAENAKRQRTVQVMELRDLPKQAPVPKYYQGKPGNNNNRHWANGRR